MTDLPPPTPPTATETTEQRWWSRRFARLPVWAWIIIGIVAIGAVGSLAGDEEDAGPVEAAPPVTSAPPAAEPTEPTDPAVTTEPPAPTQAPTTPPPTAPPTTPAPTSPPTTAPPEEGTRANPFPKGTALSFGDYLPMYVGTLEFVDYTLIREANQFNDEPGPGQRYARVKIDATYTGDDRGSYSDFMFSMGVVGAKGKIYEPEFLSDVRRVLDDISNASDVLAGGTLSGFLYYLVDEDDSGFLLVNDGGPSLTFVDINPDI